MDIDTMPEGREMDELVAEALGWVRCSGEGHETHMMSAVGAAPYYHHDNGMAVGLPHFSTSMGDAWEVAEKLKMTITPNLCGEPIRAKWCADVQLRGENDLWLAGAETPALAICRAALKAVVGDGNGR